MQSLPKNSQDYQKNNAWIMFKLFKGTNRGNKGKIGFI